MDEQSEPIDYARLCHLAEVAEAHIERMNDQIRFAFDAGIAVEGALPPRVVSVKPYDPGRGPEESGQVTLAVLLVPKGLGVIYRDTEDPPEEFTLSWLRHAMTPVSELGPAARLELLPHAVELMAVFERAME